MPTLAEIMPHRDLEGFTDRKGLGNTAEDLVAAYFRQWFDVAQSAQTICQDHEDPSDWANECDLTVNGHRIEVKSIGRSVFQFGPDPTRFPRPWMIMDNCSIWDAKDPKPLAYVYWSEATGAMLCSRGGDPGQPHKLHDGRVGVDRHVYRVFRHQLRGVDALAWHLANL